MTCALIIFHGAGIIIALIGAVATILAAVVSGMFSNKDSKESEDDQQ